MPMLPASPEGLPDLVEAFAHTTQAVIDLAHDCSDQDLMLPTACPGWTVHDQISHVAGVEAGLEGVKDPPVEVPPYAHIRNDLGKKVEHAVEVRRGRTGAEVVVELEHLLVQRLSTLRSPGLTDSSIIAGPFGPDQAATVVLMRTFDVWAHEQDIRSALGRPGNLGSPAAALFVGSVLAQLPRLVARDAGVEAGQYVVLEITGPGSVPGSVVACQGVRVQADGQGHLRGHAMTADPPPDRPTTRISLSTEAFTRRAAGRRSPDDTAYGVVGDEEIARRVVQALVVTH